LRVLYLNPCGHLGGAERALLDVLTSVRQAEPEWQLRLLAGEDGPLLAEALAIGVESSVLPFPESVAVLGQFSGSGLPLVRRCVAAAPSLMAYRKQLQQAIREFGPDLVHTNGFKMHLLGAWSAEVPTVWHLHDFLSARPWMKRLLRPFSRNCRTIVAISNAVASDARLAMPRNTVRTLLNAVNLDRFTPRGNRLDLDALSDLAAPPPETIRVGLVGAFAQWKGHHVFLKAVAQLRKENWPLRAYIIGGPLYQTAGSQFTFDELRSAAKKLGISDAVGFTGFQPDAPAAFRALDVVVHASTSPEPFGLVIAEAMACGRAVIASRAGGACEIFRQGCDALGTYPGDPRALAVAIRRLVQDPVLRARLGRAARETAESRFDRNRLAHSLISIYRSALIACDYSTSTAAISTAA